jgi:hypothetical protein
MFNPSKDEKGTERMRDEDGRGGIQGYCLVV